MAEEPIALSQAAFSDLADTALEVNYLSDEIGKFVSDIENGLRSLNLGVSSSVQIERRTNERGDKSWTESLGFEKINKNWCIAITSTCESEDSDAYLEYDVWPFSEAPRLLRVKAVDHLPFLLMQLNSDAEKLRDKLMAKLDNVVDISKAVNRVVGKKAKEQVKK